MAMGPLEGKKLLVLTGCLGDRDIVDYARSQGAFVIATDYLHGGAAKTRANVAENVSTVDLDGLRELAKRYGIHGLVTGASLASTKTISILGEELNLHVPHSAQALSNIDDKAALNRLCRKHGVPAPHQFREADVTEVNLPIIVKPVDASNSVGISRVTRMSELGNAVALARNHSPTERDDTRLVFPQVVEEVKKLEAHFFAEQKLFMEFHFFNWPIPPLDSK